VLQRIIVGRITFSLRRNEVSGEIDSYDFEAPTRFDGLSPESLWSARRIWTQPT
jgi:hypothetical protein